MSTVSAPDWGDLTPAERAAMRLDSAAMHELHEVAHRSPGYGSLDPARMADAERREAAAELAEVDEEAAIARGHRPPR